MDSCQRGGLVEYVEVFRCDERGSCVWVYVLDGVETCCPDGENVDERCFKIG